MIKRLFLAFLILLALSSLGYGQSSSRGNITESYATCASTNACVKLRFPSSIGLIPASVTVTLTGTFSATVDFEQSADSGVTWVAATGTPQPSGSASTSTTSTGVWVFDVASRTDFRVRGSAYTSGTVGVFIDSSPAQLSSGTGVGGISSLNGLTVDIQLFSTGTTDPSCFIINPGIDTHEFNIMSADATRCGLLTADAQIIGGNKTFFGDTLMNGSLYVTDFLSTDNPVETTCTDPTISEANVGLFGCDPTTELFWYSVDGSAPTIIAPPATGSVQSIGTGLLTGGGVVWTGDLNFSVSPATYLIGGTSYSSPLTAITLDAADAVNPRIDRIVVDNTGAAVKITGTAATPPAAPSIDPTTQVDLSGGLVYIAALATTPANFSTTDLYLENTEWTCTASANFNCASTSNPYAGTKDIEATTAVSGNNVTLVKPAAATENLSASSNLVFYIRSKAAWPNPKSVLLSWLNGSTPVGTAVTLDDGLFGFSSSTTADYQQITIPTSAWGTGGNLVTTLKIQVLGGGSSIGFYLDNIFLQAQTGSAQPVANPYDVVTFFPGVPGASEVLSRVVFTRQVAFPIALAGSYASAGTAATASTIVSTKKNGAAFGTCTFAIAGTTCTFASTVGAVFAAGDVLTVTAPAGADATLADIAITLAGTR